MTRRATIRRPALADWLELRHRYIGASEIAAIVGEHPFLSAAELAARKLSATNAADNLSMARGRYLEDAVARWWGSEHGVELVEPEFVYLYDDTLIATLDRLAGDTVVEIKTTATHCRTPPAHWLDQVQTQLLATGLVHAHIVVLDASLQLSTFDVEADPVHQMTLYRAAATFLDHIRAGRIPPGVSMDYKAATILHPEPLQPAVELDDETLSRCGQLRQLQQQIKALEADEDRLKGQIACQLGNAAEGTYDGRRVVTWRSVTRTGVDVKRLRREQPEIVDCYRQDYTYRQLRLVQSKEDA